ncbi:unnamed protein product [Gordionus sp. m RMFG-2023]|uniref:ATP synthase subunit e, mitochondrial-like n=1 Tax=Gordionus sp. m RMFG-2023 TaxID=3053472 RepID=UPI0030E0ABB2
MNLNKVVLQPPREVSPLIRGARWSFLLLGVVYGIYRNRSLTKKEIIVREMQLKQKVIKDEQDKKLKEYLNIEELKYLSKELGTTFS